MKFFPVVPGLLILSLLALPAGAQDEDFRLGVADVIQVSVWKNEELSVRTQVRPDGLISLPLIGDVQAAGLRPSELEETLSERFEEFVAAPSVSVVVETINSMKVFITGRVNSPGAYDVIQPTRLLQALAMAGGLDEFARAGKIVVLRQLPDGSQRRTEVSVKAITSGRNPEDNLLLQPGDTIVVP